jgi:23S rRNA (cytosine1962-C5)-methyltransferase
MPPPPPRGERPVVQLAGDQLPSGPWIYARQVVPPPEPVEPGALVEVQDASRRFVGHALYNPASDIRLRVLSRGKRSELDRPREFLLRRLAFADRLRKKVLRLPEVTDAWRVAHAEGDDLPGLVVDHLAGVLVCEHHSLGFWRLRSEIEQALSELYPGARVLHRVPKAARRAEGFEPEEEPEDVGTLSVREHGIELRVRPAVGHKTGHFCDQRDNRLLVGGLARGGSVLDLFTNGGGFALQCARQGARRVRAVDLDEGVLALAAEAVRASGLAVELEHADAFDVLRAERDAGRRHELVIVDPHKLVTGRARLEAGLRAYNDLNALALACVRPGGLLASFSCSGAVDLPTFLGTLFHAARRAERGIRLLATLGAGPDHPQRPDFPRSRYLKGALLAVD